MNAVTEQMPEPLVFTDSAANKVQAADRGGRQPRAQAAGIRHRRRLLGLPVRLHVRRGDERRRHDAAERRRHAAHRSDEPAVPDGRRDRLSGEHRRRAVRDQEPERDVDLRLRVVVLRLSRNAQRRAVQTKTGAVGSRFSLRCCAGCAGSVEAARAWSARSRPRRMRQRPRHRVERGALVGRDRRRVGHRDRAADPCARR